MIRLDATSTSQPTLFGDEAAPHAPAPAPRFNGADYVPSRDDARLGSQYRRIFAAMADGAWRSLPAIERLTHDPPASISAQLRHMRKPRFGGHTINRRHCGDGLYEYQLVPAEGDV